MAASPSSSYQVIARRYRPQTFSSVVGQRAVVQQLHNEIHENRIGHGYLFCGPRGTGKTSMARIFAKALNCQHGPTTTPCGECGHCQEIAAGNHLDVIEVDAATYTKVDNMRDLLEGLGRAPFSARYKIYIIDEVHMLSTSSFNALLKSLEEPPSHVIFILATTNPEKIPETVVSRCRRCNFDRIGLKEITGNLEAILQKEEVKVAVDEHAAILNAVALASDGGLRDAQVLLDQLISLTDDELRLDTVRSLLGVVESDLFVRLFKALVDRDSADCLLLIGELVDRGRDLQRFVKMFLSFLRDAMILRAGGSADLARVVDADSEEFKSILERTTLPFLLNAIQQFLTLEERMRGAAPPRFLFEFTLIKLTAIDPRLIIDPNLGGGPGIGAGVGGERSSRPAARRQPTPGAGNGGTHARARSLEQVAVLNDSAVAEHEQPAAVIEQIPTTDEERWTAFREYAAQANASIRGTLGNARLRAVTGSKLIIELSPADRALLGVLDRPETIGMLRDAARKAWNRNLLPVFEIADGPVEPTAPMADIIPFVPRPAPQKTKPSPPRPFSEELSLEEAFERYPEFREACGIVEQHFGIKPALLNGRKISGSKKG